MIFFILISYFRWGFCAILCQLCCSNRDKTSITPHARSQNTLFAAFSQRSSETFWTTTTPHRHSFTGSNFSALCGNIIDLLDAGPTVFPREACCDSGSSLLILVSLSPLLCWFHSMFAAMRRGRSFLIDSQASTSEVFWFVCFFSFIFIFH